MATEEEREAAWNALMAPRRKHPWARCEECPLNDQGLFVPSDGPAKAKLAFVGEAAGRHEVTDGRPFTGMSGQLLDRVNKHHGIYRGEVLLTNATLCRPPGVENLSPPQSAIKACRPRLVHELQERGVETVVALGNVASQSLLASGEGVSKLRVGLGRKSPYLGSVRVIPTFHPAACLRSPDFFPSLVADVGKVNREQVPWEPPKYVVYDDPSLAITALKELEEYPGTRLVMDIETDKEKDVDYDHPNNYELLCIGLCYTRKRVVVIERNALKDDGVLRQLGRTLRSKELSAQGGKYDTSGLYPRVGALELVFDTMFASYARDERRGIHGLEHQGVEILGTPEWKHALDKWNPKKNGYGAIPPDELDKYNAYDCATTWELEDYYREHMTPDQWMVHDLLIAASNQLQYVELNGIAIDRKYNAELMHSYLEEMAVIKEHLREVIDNPEWTAFNPNSPKQVKEVIEGVFETNVPMKRNQKGQMAKSTDVETLTALMEAQAPESPFFDFLSSMLEWRKEAKLYGTYVKGIRKRMYRGRVYPVFLLHGTTSGRLACRNPNLQNVPRGNKIRSQFVPAHPDNVFVSVDYSQAELRVLTWLAQEEYFRRIFNDPSRDLFTELMPVLYGDISQAAWYQDPEQKKHRRVRVKAYVYGLAYGREALSIAQEFRITYREAQDGMDAFFGVIPNVVAYQKSVEETIKSGKDLTTPFGRHRRFYLLTRHNIDKTVKEGLSFQPQSISSDLCLRAFTRVRPALRGKAYVRNIVHDNIMAECHRDNADEVGQIINNYMIESAHELVGDYVDFRTDISIGNSWGEV